MKKSTPTHHALLHQVFDDLFALRQAMSGVAACGRFEDALDDSPQCFCALVKLFATQLDRIAMQLNEAFDDDAADASADGH